MNSEPTNDSTALPRTPCSAGSIRPEYPSNVEHFIAKWQPNEDARRKAFWKEFRKAANAYSQFKQNSKTHTPQSGCVQ
jgi:hypothetical protein